MTPPPRGGYPDTTDRWTMETTQGAALWALRMCLIYAGGRLTAAGYGDDALWTEVIGVTVTLVGIAWSYFARRAAQNEVPPDALAVVVQTASAVKSDTGARVIPPDVVEAARTIAGRLG